MAAEGDWLDQSVRTRTGGNLRQNLADCSRLAIRPEARPTYRPQAQIGGSPLSAGKRANWSNGDSRYSTDTEAARHQLNVPPSQSLAIWVEITRIILAWIIVSRIVVKVSPCLLPGFIRGLPTFLHLIA